MRNYYLLLLLCLTSVLNAQQLLSPEEFLGYAPGDRFTRHHRVIEYFRHVAGEVSNVKIVQYGETYEHRPLVYAIITSGENFRNLEEIRLNNLKRTGLIEGAPTADKKAIVWMSYNVHGNESSSTEASMLTLYALANSANRQTQEWLKNTVVIIDPCINPDGRDRYANFYNQYGNMPANPRGDAKEHHEPWPGGRANHYLFDLNRDWAWETQIETQQRLKAYHQWMPQIHIDFHEMNFDSPYFFAPASKPFHEVISAWQREFQTMIGRNNARYFDEHGWLYFTKEQYDLYYPSYGDTYPIYNGAVGMTYEQGGGGYGGKTISTKEADTLTLKDRLMHHFTTGLSTIEITSKNADRVVDEFEKFFHENNTAPVSPYKTYVIKAGNNGDKVATLLKWMDTQSIRYGHPAGGKTVRGFDYQTQAVTSFTLNKEDIIFNIYQPKSRFITTVFEPQSNLQDSLTYDITTWNLMYAFGLQAYATTERINIGQSYHAVVVENNSVPEKPYAYIFEYGSLQDVSLMTALMGKGIKVRCAEKAFAINGHNYAPGTLLVTRRNNESIPNFDAVVTALANSAGRKIHTTTTGFVDSGKDFGSGEVRYLKAPKIAVLVGEETSSLSAGEIWHFFEQQVHYPITQIGTSYFKEVDLSRYDVLIVPEGRYKLFDEKMRAEIIDWVSDGGKLIVLANGLEAFVDMSGFGLKHYAKESEKVTAKDKEKDQQEKDMLVRYEDAERKQISKLISGAIYKVTLDNSHPLTFGLNNTYYTLKTSEHRYGFLENGWNVGTIRGKAKPVQGFAGKLINSQLDNSLQIGMEEKGRGSIVYLVDNPLFRCFWEDGKMLFANAVFIAGH